MSYESITKRIQDVKRNALENPYMTLSNVRNDIDENFALRKAEKANNDQHGYTQKYGEDGYVEVKDRHPRWRDVSDLIQLRWESRTEKCEENDWALGLMIHSLSYRQLRAIADTIKEGTA